MTRLTLRTEPQQLLAEQRKKAVGHLNQAFDARSSFSAHRDAAHARKREVAFSVLRGGQASPAWAEEASLRGLSLVEFASLIISKPAAIDAVELERQKRLLAIEAATSIDEIDKIVISGVTLEAG